MSLLVNASQITGNPGLGTVIPGRIEGSGAEGRPLPHEWTVNANEWLASHISGIQTPLPTLPMSCRTRAARPGVVLVQPVVGPDRPLIAFRWPTGGSADEDRRVAQRTSFASHEDFSRQPGRGSKRRLKRLQRQVTRREIILAVLAAIGLTLAALFSLVAHLEHLEEHKRRRQRRER
jgi:hypothetical protein